MERLVPSGVEGLVPKLLFRSAFVQAAARSFARARHFPAELLLQRLRVGPLLQLADDLLHFPVNLFPGRLGHAPHHPAHGARIVLVHVRKFTLHRRQGGLGARVVARAGRGIERAFPLIAVSRRFLPRPLQHRERRDGLDHPVSRMVRALRNAPALRQGLRVKLVNPVIVRTIIFVNRHGIRTGIF